MKIVRKISQHRRDFSADFECEACGHIAQGIKGYDDRYFHDQVIPDMKCKQCGKSRNDLGIVAEKTTTKYEAWETV